MTVAFLISCGFWILLWLPKTLADLFYWYDADIVRIYMGPMQLPSAVIEQTSLALFNLYSLINPLFLIFVTKSFQEPIKGLWAKLCLQCKRSTPN